MFEVDRFEDTEPTKRVGAHRAKPRLGSPMARFLIAALSTLILITAGIFVIKFQPGNVSYSDNAGPSEPVKEQVQPLLNPEATLIILNGTEIDDLAYFVDDAITENEWGVILFSGDAEKTDVRTSAVFYAEAADEAAALALGEKLGGIKAYQNPEYMQFGNQLAVLLGEDYQGPGLEEAKSGEHHRLGEGVSLDPQYQEPEWVEGEWIDGEWVEGGWVEGGWVEDQWGEEQWVEEQWVEVGWVDED